MADAAPSQSAIVLYTGPLSMFGAKAEIALREKRVDFERVSVPYDAKAGYAPKHPTVASVNPKGQVPVLTHGALAIFDSTQIFEYLEDLAPEPPLWPRDRDERARARLLELQSDEVYFPHVIRLMGMQSDLASAPALTAIEGADLFHARMETLLKPGAFLAGAFSFVDIAFFMAQLFGERMGARLGDGTPKLADWRRRVANRPSVTTTLEPLKGFLKARNRPTPSFLE